jgi:hypothetical protein
MDPVAYAPLPSAPQPSAPPVDSIITVRPKILTIRFENPAAVIAATTNRRWLGYCIFIIFVVLFALGAFYFMMFGVERKN